MSAPPPVPPRRTTSTDHPVVEPHQIYQMPAQSVRTQNCQPQNALDFYSAPQITSNPQVASNNFQSIPQNVSQNTSLNTLYIPQNPPQNTQINYETAILHQPTPNPKSILSTEVQKCKPYQDLLNTEQKFLRLVASLETNLRPLIQAVGSATDQTFVRVYQSHLRSMLVQINAIRTAHSLFEKSLKNGVCMNLGEQFEKNSISATFACHEIYNTQMNKIVQLKCDDTGIEISSSGLFSVFKSKKKVVSGPISKIDEILQLDNGTKSALKDLMENQEFIACCNDWRVSSFHELATIIMYRPLTTRNYIQAYNKHWTDKMNETEFTADDSIQKIVFSDIHKLEDFRSRLDTVIQKMQDEVKASNHYQLIEPFIKILKIFGKQCTYNFYCDVQSKHVEVKSPQYMNRASRTKTYPELTVVLFSASSLDGGIQLLIILEDTNNYAKHELPNFTFMFDSGKSRLTTESDKGQLRVVCHNLVLLKPQCRECSDGFNPKSISFCLKKRDYDQLKFNVDSFVEHQMNSVVETANFHQKMRMRSAKLNQIYQ